MKNKKEFLVSVEKVIKVTLDMDKYQGEILKQIVDLWGYEEGYYEDDQEILEEIVKDIAIVHVRDGDLQDIEGLAIDGHISKDVDTHIEIKH